MTWLFEPATRTGVNIELTQRNQFENDDVNLSDSLIRESIQNCLDASLYDHLLSSKSGNSIDKKVVVSFRWIKPTDIKKFKDLFQGQLNHAESAGLNLEHVDFDNPRVLIIEDYGTTGLLGEVDEKDNEDFANFWRRYGQSSKSGSKKGRHGLGKLVFPLTSLIGVFFGLTKRYNDEKQYLMGQSVLNVRSVDGKEYPPHGFYCQPINENEDDPISMPYDDDEFVNEFSKLFSVNRKSESGLSIVVPFPDINFNAEDLISKAIENYFYAIFSKKLVLKFNDITIDDTNLRQLAVRYSKKMSDSDHIFEFLDEIFKEQEVNYFWLKNVSKDGSIRANHFSGDDLDKIRKKFAEQQLISLKIPISIIYKNSSKISKDTHFNVFLKKKQNLERGYALYFRGGLQLTSEAQFTTQKAIGAVIANDNLVSELIGDAENEAHTKMVIESKRLKDKYSNSYKIIPIIKNSLIQIHELIEGLDSSNDDIALLDFFGFKKPDSLRANEKRKRVVVDPLPNLDKYKIDTVPGGFALSAFNAQASIDKPTMITVEMAYDRPSFNPFKKYKRYDFDLTSEKFVVEKDGINQFEVLSNKIILSINSKKFKLSVVGFDPKRDLKVRVT